MIKSRRIVEIVLAFHSFDEVTAQMSMQKENICYSPILLSTAVSFSRAIYGIPAEYCHNV
jgi:hypothetical protein